MPPKTVSYGQQGRDVIRRGVTQLAAAVKVTLAPCGRSAMFNKGFGPPLITRDGATVAKQIELPDPMEYIGAQMIKDVAKKTAKDAGDGTTTATIHAEPIFEEGLKNITAGAEAMEVRRGIERAVAAVAETLKNMAVEIKTTEQMVQIAICAANHDEKVGRIAAEAMEPIGRTGVPTIEEGQGLDTTTERVDGLQFDKVLSSASASFGYNVLADKCGDLVAMGVIVPTKVERVALQNASAIAAFLLTTDAVVCEITKEENRRPLRRSA